MSLRNDEKNRQSCSTRSTLIPSAGGCTMIQASFTYNTVAEDGLVLYIYTFSFISYRWLGVCMSLAQQTCSAGFDDEEEIWRNLKKPI